MRFFSYIAVAAAALAVQVASLPLGVRTGYEIIHRDISSISKLAEIVKDLETKITKGISLPKGVSLPKRSPVPVPAPVPEAEAEAVEEDIEVEEDPSPVAGSGFNKKSTIEENDEVEEKLEKRFVSGQVPGVGISQDLPSGIVMFMIIFMLYAMITAISMKDE
ncbi:hypothetical protein H072_9548 [Dactylellina haptotyla CBS 200.50]|uniref:Uncharacterized protein n=1 Tax=Dactylellina haptotyla (strain CBS 200.50) TaxID=1284197 RepID=S8A2G4_DACHA|nr:hypothetical protein H072_9548 [Dactylellina haptotyla CBS 200.50]